MDGRLSMRLQSTDHSPPTRGLAPICGKVQGLRLYGIGALRFKVQGDGREAVNETAVHRPLAANQRLGADLRVKVQGLRPVMVKDSRFSCLMVPFSKLQLSSL